LSENTRRLAAIMFTDVVGYSTMASEDERRGLQLLSEHRDLLHSVFPEYGGRVVKTLGDGFLVEFASAVQAVDCAVAAQKKMALQNAGRRPDERIMIRIGVHVGDVVSDGGDVLGDAVNVAARVQPLAEPGGVCITRQVVDQIERKVGYKLVKVGTRELKNIRYPVEIYRVLMPSDMSRFEERPSLDPHRLAILPLTNLSADPNDKYFADGMTEELIATVSRIGELSVISRTSVMRYKDTTTPIGEIGAELSAGTVLEGSVRKADNRVRITVQLIDAKSDKHLWSQSYERDLTNVFAIQLDIAQQVADALKVELLSKVKQSMEREKEVDPAAYSLYLRGRFYWNERTEPGVRKALGYFEDAIKIEPGFAPAYSGVADCYLILADYLWMPPQQAASKAKEYAMKALELDDSLAEAHASLGLTMLLFFFDFSIAELEFKRALELRPSYAQALHWYTSLMYYSKRFDESTALETRAAELDPYSRVISMGLGIDFMIHGKMDEAMKQFDKVIELNPDFGAVHYWKGFTFACLSEYDDAVREAKKAVELQGYATADLLLAWIYAASGQTEAAEKILEEVISGKGNRSPVSIGAVKLLLGQDDEGFSWLRRGLEEHDTNLYTFGFAPQERKFLSDPKWKEIEGKLGLPPGSKFPDWPER